MDSLQSIVRCKDYEDLDEEKAARSVVVSNIPPNVGGQLLFIHFQKSKNGGGEIDRLCMIESEETAVITFEEVDVARAVLAREQIFQKSGTKFTVQPFEVVRPPEVPEVFQRVSARLNWEIFRSLGPFDSRKLLRRLATETEVEWHEACDGYIISGTFEQLQNAYEQLNRDLHRVASQNPELRRELSSNKGGDVATNSVSEDSEDSLEKDDKKSKNKEKVQENPPFDVEPRFMTILKEQYSEMLEDIEKKYSVRVEWPLNGEDLKALIKALADCKQEDYNDAHDKFCEFYLGLLSRMKQEVITHSKSDSEVKAVLDLVSGAFKVMLFEEAGKVIVYGEVQQVEPAAKTIKFKLGLENEKENTKRRKNKNVSVDEVNGQSQDGMGSPNFDPSFSSTFQQVLANGVRLSVYQGDITNQHVDVIVNAANGWLNHDGGVAKAIQDKGGLIISEQSRNIIFSRTGRPLSVGDAVFTSGGNLPCSIVIHTVGPVWGQQHNQQSKLLLHRAVISSLRMAASYNFRSIALPAISSGSFGMPKELCARTMFDAVQEYSQSLEARQFHLCDISFINIDPPTVKAFKQEFVKRFKEGTTVTSNNESQIPAVGGSIGPQSLPFQNQEISYYSMPASNSMPPTINQHHHQFQNFQPNATDQRQAFRLPLSQPSNTVPNHNMSFQSLQMSAAPPTYPTGDTLHEKVTSIEQEKIIEHQFDGNKVSSDVAKGTTTTDSNTAFKRGSANKSSANFTEHGNGSGNVRSRGRGRGIIAANFICNSFPGTAVKVGREAEVTKPQPNTQNVQNKDFELPTTNTIATKVETKNTPEHPPGIATDSSSKTTSTTDSQNKLPKGENEERNNLDQTQVSGENPILKQKDDGCSSETGSNHKRQADNISFSPTGELQENKGEFLESDLLKTSVQKTPMKTETKPAGKKNDEVISDKTKSQVKSPLLTEQNESMEKVRTSSFDHTATAGEKESFVQGHGTSTHEKEKSSENPVVEVKELELREVGDETTTPQHKKEGHEQSNIATNDGESDSSKKSEVQDNVSVPQIKGESKQHIDNRNTVCECDDANLPREHGEQEKEKEKEKDNVDCQICETTQKLAENAATQDTSSTPEVKEEQAQDSEDEPMPSLSDFSEEDNNATSPLQVPHKTDNSGEQPIGYMKWLKDVHHLPGYEKYGTIVIQYSFPQGYQGQGHASPGVLYLGCEYEAYLPDLPEGRQVRELLTNAFDKRKLFTLKHSNVIGEPAQIVWGDIPHKTSRTGGPSENGYPDPSYLGDVKKKLLEHGIVLPSK